jgi:hypothetical protein
MKIEEFELEQYRALRAEILRAMEEGNQVMSFGLATIGVITSASLGIKESAVGYIIFSILLPCLTSLILSLWFASQERIARASYFLSGIEERLNDLHDIGSMVTWEIWLRNRGIDGKANHFWSTEYSGIVLLAFLVVVPIMASFFTGGKNINGWTRLWVISVTSVALSVFCFSFKSRISRWRGWLSDNFATEVSS